MYNPTFLLNFLLHLQLVIDILKVATNVTNYFFTPILIYHKCGRFEKLIC